MTDEQRRYVLKAKESLRAAEVLHDMQSYEIAVSRAYEDAQKTIERARQFIQLAERVLAS